MADVQLNGAQGGVHAESTEQMKSLVPDLPLGRELEDGSEYPVDAISKLENAYPSTQALHADESLDLFTDVAPPIHVSTTFRYPKDHGILKPALERTVGLSPAFPLFQKGAMWDDPYVLFM